MSWKQDSFKPKVTSSPGGKTALGVLLLPSRKLSHQLARKWESQSQVLGSEGGSEHGGCSCLNKMCLWQRQEKQTGQKKSVSPFYSSSLRLEVAKPRQGEHSNSAHASRTMCHMHRAAGSLGQGFKDQQSSEGPEQSGEASLVFVNALKQTSNKQDAGRRE